MKTVQKITLCGLLAALAVVAMLLGFFPYFTYTAPAFAALAVMIAVMETDLKWAFGTYVVSAVIVLILGENESKMLFVFFFGLYPVVKALAEKFSFKGVEFSVKFAHFNASMLLVYGVLSVLSGISTEEFSLFGKYGALLFLLFGNLVFILYDFALSRLAVFYFIRLHDRISSLFRLHR